MTLHLRSRREHGSALSAALFISVICVSLSAASVAVARGWQGAASAELNRERAFQLAESGVDWAIARMRARHGSLPESDESGSLPGVGLWSVSYGPGDSNGADDDGDGSIDESDEDNFTVLTSTGTAGGVSRHIRVLLRTPTAIAGFEGATVFNVDAPVLDLNGNAFNIEGEEHFIDGTLDSTRTAKYSVASPATVATLTAQVSSTQRDNMTGLGGSPAMGQVAAIDLNALVLESQRAASVTLAPGTYSGRTFGTPVEGGTEVVNVPGDLHLSGNTQGAGILVVDGDLRISGSFTWTGIILVRGRTSMVGGGGTKRLVGSLVVGEEVGSTSDSTSVTVSGTIDLLYSTDAVDLAARSLVVPVVIVWTETGSP